MTSSRPAKPHTPGMAMPRDYHDGYVTVRCWVCGDDMEGYDHICGDCQESLSKTIYMEADDG